MDPGEELARVPQITKIRSVLCAMLVSGITGVFYSLSNINPYISAYHQNFDPDLNHKHTLIIMPLWMVFQSFGIVISISLCNNYGHALVSNTAATVFSGCYLLMIFVKHYWVFVFLSGIVPGFTVGIIYAPSLYVAWSYYPDRKSILSGISLFTGGFTAAILGPLSTWLINPSNKPDVTGDPAVLERVPFLYFCEFVLFGGISIALWILQPDAYETQVISELRILKLLEEINADIVMRETLAQNSMLPGSHLVEDVPDPAAPAYKAKELKPVSQTKQQFDFSAALNSSQTTPPKTKSGSKKDSTAKTPTMRTLVRKNSMIAHEKEALAVMEAKESEASPNKRQQIGKRMGYRDLGENIYSINQRDFMYVICKTLKLDTDGFVAQQEAVLMSGIEPESLAAVVVNRNIMKVLIQDRKNCIRERIKNCGTKETLRASILEIKAIFESGDVRARVNRRWMQTWLPEPFDLDEAEGRFLDLIEPPNPKPVIQFDDEDHHREGVRLLISQSIVCCPSLRAAVRSPQFLAIAIMAFCCSLYPYFMNSVWKHFYLETLQITEEVGDRQLSVLLSLGSFANSFVRIVSGLAILEYGFKPVYFVMVLSSILCGLTISSAMRSYPAGAAYLAQSFAGLGVQFTIFPPLCFKIFGPMYGAQIYPIVIILFSFSNLTQYIVYRLDDPDWHYMFEVCGLAALGGLVALVCFDLTPDWTSSRQTERTIKQRSLPSNKTPLLYK